MRRVLLILPLVLCHPAWSTVVSVGSGAFTSPTVSTFNGNTTFDNVTSYTNNGATFTASSLVFIFSNVADLNQLNVSAMDFNVSLAAPANLIGFDSELFAGTTVVPFDVVSVELYSDNNFTNLIDTYSTLTQMDPSNQFFGLQDDQSVQSVKFNLGHVVTANGGFSPLLNDFLVQANSAPEPASASLGGLGLLIAGAGLCANRLRSFRNR